MADPTRPVLTLSDLESFDPRARPGERRRFCCPLCGLDKPRDAAHRCLSLESVSGLWKCFRCGESGMVQEHWRARDGVSKSHLTRQTLQRAFAVPPAARVVESRVGQGNAPPLDPPIPADGAEEVQAAGQPEAAPTPNAPTPRWWELWEKSRPLLENDPATRYLQARRGLSFDVAQSAGLRFCSQWPGGAAVVFPLLDLSGNTVAIQGRSLLGSAKISYGPRRHAAFWAPTRLSSGRLIHPLDRVFEGVILVEAPLDALSLALAGFPALALCGTSGPEWLPVACGLRRVFGAFDADEAGDRAFEDLSRVLEPYGACCERLRPEGAKDWNEILVAHGASDLEDFVALRVL